MIRIVVAIEDSHLYVFGPFPSLDHAKSWIANRKKTHKGTYRIKELKAP